jgi:2-oxo-4-hydroxy-4-carboxy-5-ureidoimidazoline decarboxylase
MAEPQLSLDALPEAEARAQLARCCGAARWVEAMLARRPFGSRAALLEAAEQSFAALEDEDFLEAFAQHPRIGEDLAALRARFPASAAWASAEQAGVSGADDATLLALREANREYYERFGFIFIICASGKSAAQLLSALRARLPNSRSAELALAAREQTAITRLRLEKLAP